MTAAIRRCMFVTLAIAFATSTGAAQVRVDDRLPDYKPIDGVSGHIHSVGTDTLNNLMTLWCEVLYERYPRAVFEIEGRGSRTAEAALLDGTANLGTKVVDFTPEQIARFREKFGAPPVSVTVAYDVLAVFVHKDNPIESLSLKQLDAIFSSTRKHGHASDIATWGDLGLKGEFKDKPITACGRNSASGSYGFFKTVALAKGDFKDTVKEQPGSSAVVQAVGDDPFAIGYSGLGYKTDAVRAVPLLGDDGKPIEANSENAISGKYPLGRRLLVAMRPLPKDGLEPLRREFFRLVFSQQGQEIVVRDGYFPLPFDVAAEEAKKVGIVLEAAKIP